MLNLSVIIMTKDEEKNLPIALESLAALHVDIFIVDSGSSDSTHEISMRAGCQFFIHEFSTHAKQLNWALENLPIKTEWVMRLDADERLTPELVLELKNSLAEIDEGVSGLMFKRRVFFWGHWIRFGGYYPIWLLRIWRRGKAVCEDRDMDEHMVVKTGRIEKLAHDIIDENRKGLSFWIEKHNQYSDREMAVILGISNPLRAADTGGQVARKRFVKETFYARMPRFWRAAFYWAYRYFILLGFLDGKAGAVFHFLQGFWYRFIIDAKLQEQKIRSVQQR